MRRAWLVLALASARCSDETVPPCETCVLPAAPLPRISHGSGWDDPPASGHMFVIDELKIAESPDIGFSVDGKCRVDGHCAENAFAPIGQLGNDQVRQGLLGAETLILMELAGVDEPFTGDDPEITVKFYRGMDADASLANNFMIPMGETSCCRFLVDISSVDGDPPQARSRLPAKIEQGQLKSTSAIPIEFLLTIGVPPYPAMRIEHALLSARVSADIDSPPPVAKLHDGLLGGAVPVRTLAGTENPYCKTVSDPLCPALIPESTLIDLAVALAQPDIDLDADNDLDSLKRDVLGNGRVDKCVHLGADINPIASGDPWTCALAPEMRDGFSIAIELEAVGATVLGFGAPSYQKN
jgi:hypothetical protein